MPPHASGRPSCRLVLLLATLPALGAAPARADGVEGTLSVSVQVVESCRVPAPSGLGTELAPCPAVGARTAPARSGSAAAAASGAGTARTVVERAADGAAWLTTIF
jgi:hypothetical protein